MAYNSWVELEFECPIDISRIKRYADDFESNIDIPIHSSSLDEVKESLIKARGDLDLMINALIQLLHDRTILKSGTDMVLFGWLKDDLGRLLQKIDEDEYDMIIRYDVGKEENNRVNVTRLSAYAKLLKTISDAVIYECLYKATKEYHSFKETSEIKKEKRTFLYILFGITHLSLSVFGSITRQGKTLTQQKKGTVQTFPSSFQSLMGVNGQQKIKEEHEREIGSKVSDEEWHELDEDDETILEDEDGELIKEDT